MCFWRCFVNCKHTWQYSIRNPSNQPHSNPPFVWFSLAFVCQPKLCFISWLWKYLPAFHLCMHHICLSSTVESLKFLRFSFYWTALSYLHCGKVAHHHHDSSWMLCPYWRDKENFCMIQYLNRCPQFVWADNKHRLELSIICSTSKSPIILAFICPFTASIPPPTFCSNKFIDTFSMQ